MRLKLLTLSIIFICSSSFAQEYIPMLQEGNSWSISTNTGVSISSTQYSVGENEVINGITYTAIAGCLYREENGFVYAFDILDNQESPIPVLNFNLEINDIFTINPNNSCSGVYSFFDELIVTDVRTEFIAGLNRKVIELVGIGNGEFPSQLWIEGIGSTIGGFNLGLLDFDIVDSLMCFSNVSNETTFFNGFDTCVIDLGVDDQKKKLTFISPNPITPESVLQLPNEDFADRIEIYNLQGQHIKEANINNSIYEMNAMNYEAGLYFYQIFSQNRLLESNKFIIK